MKIEWVNSYNVHRARLGLIDLVVGWESSRDLPETEKGQFPYGYYTVSIVGAGPISSKKKFKEMDEAKVYVIALAKSRIAEIAEQLSLAVTANESGVRDDR